MSLRDRQALCPAGQTSTQCSRLEEVTCKVYYRFEWNHERCGACPLRTRCVGRSQVHRTLLVGEYHEWLQARRRAMARPDFNMRRHPRNGIEESMSELNRGYGFGRSRYRGLAKTAADFSLLA